MKYIVILADGMADHPVEQLGGKTPMEAADKPMMDYFAAHGDLFLVQTVPGDCKPGSDVANLSVMGYDPHQYYTGRSPLEAASIGVTLKDNQTAFRTNLVTLSEDMPYANKTMVDYSSDEITTQEADTLIQALNDGLSTDNIHFYTGVSYRHLLVWDDAPASFQLTPPHDISDRKITDYLPSDPTILDMMEKSVNILKKHPINQERIRKGLHPATSIWIWGEGKRPSISSFYDKYSLKGSVISAVDLIKGIGLLSGLDSIDVEGATGNVNTNFTGKADAAVSELLEKGKDFVYVHMEAPDECGHRGEVENKVKSIELIDEKVIRPIKETLDKAGEDYVFMVLPDHPTPLALKTHVGDPVPCVIYRKGQDSGHIGRRMSEKMAQDTGSLFEPGHLLMDKFLGR